MVKLLEGPRKEARRKGTTALLGWVGTGATIGLFAVGFGSLTGAVVFGGIGAALSAYLTYRWLRFRGEWGLHF